MKICCLFIKLRSYSRPDYQAENNTCKRNTRIEGCVCCLIYFSLSFSYTALHNWLGTRALKWYPTSTSVSKLNFEIHGLHQWKVKCKKYFLRIEILKGCDLYQLNLAKSVCKYNASSLAPLLDTFSKLHNIHRHERDDETTVQEIQMAIKYFINRKSSGEDGIAG